jgi:hypothetical protein
MTLSLPPLLDAPPESDQLADYDREHFATYLFLLDWSAGMVIGTAKSITFAAPMIGIDAHGLPDASQWRLTTHPSSALWANAPAVTS